jgi:alkaline phosphatase
MNRVQQFFFVIAILFSCSAFYSVPEKHDAASPKKVIFMIGDGMGLTQITGAMAGYDGRNAFERFAVIGLSKTSSADDYVTDSGAGATAFSIGKKTFNGAIGVDADGKPQDGLFEMLKRKKWGTGVVVTSSVTHATPASFYAHVSSRKSEEDIAEFLLKDNCDVAIGGGIKFFNNRSDGKNIVKALSDVGMKTYIDSVNLVPVKDKKYVYLTAHNGMKRMLDGRGDYLKRAAMMAEKTLGDNWKNYFLMVEGSQIDWGGHANNFEYMQTELRDFNDVINAVLDEAEKDGNTLVVVTADHETGGLSLHENKGNKKTFLPNYSTTEHSGTMVGVFAYGPGADEFAGTYENTEIFNKFKKLLALN